MEIKKQRWKMPACHSFPPNFRIEKETKYFTFLLIRLDSTAGRLVMFSFRKKIRRKIIMVAVLLMLV